MAATMSSENIYNFAFVSILHCCERLSFLRDMHKLINWRQFFICLSCYWSLILSLSGCGFTRQLPGGLWTILTKLWWNPLLISAYALKTDINCFFLYNKSNCKIVSCWWLTHCINYNFVCLSTYWQWKISQWGHKNFFSYLMITFELQRGCSFKYFSSAKYQSWCVCLHIYDNKLNFSVPDVNNITLNDNTLRWMVPVFQTREVW